MARKNKYGVAPKEQRTSNGVVYHSKLEMQYRHHLNILTKSIDPKMKVLKIEEQVAFPIYINDKLICKYLLDFKVTYCDRIEFVDVKGKITAMYRVKKKMVEAYYNIKIKEVKLNQF